MNLKTAIVVTAGLMVLGLGLLNRSRRTVPAQSPEPTQPVWTRRVVKPRLSERDLISFFDRVKVSGEWEALSWALNKLGAQ